MTMSGTTISIKYKDCLYNNAYDIFFDDTRIYDAILVENGNVSLNFASYELDPLLKAVYTRFSNAEIAYDTKEIFKHKFAQKLLNVVENYIFKKKMLTEVYNLTNEDIDVINSTLAQIANNPSEVNNNGLNEALNFFDQQTGTKTRENKLNAYIKAFTLMRNGIIDEFLNEIKPLFYTVLIPTNYII